MKNPPASLVEANRRLAHNRLEQPQIKALAASLISLTKEDPDREGLLKTPERYEKAMRELTSGYHLSAEDAVGEGVFDAEGTGLITVKDIEFFSLCEHHLLPFWGSVSIGYLPSSKILGLSKLARIVNVFARRLQVQERLTKEIADSIHRLVDARAVFVKVEASHMCMMMRGVQKVNSTTATEYGIALDSLTESERSRLVQSCDISPRRVHG